MATNHDFLGKSGHQQDQESELNFDEEDSDAKGSSDSVEIVRVGDNEDSEGS